MIIPLQISLTCLLLMLTHFIAVFYVRTSIADEYDIYDKSFMFMLIIFAVSGMWAVWM